MQILFFVLSVTSVGFWLHEKFKIEEKFTLFLAMSIMIFLGILFGCFKVLGEGVCIIYIVALGWLVYCIVGKSGQLKDYFSSLSIWVFVFSSIIYGILYMYKVPFFCAWDEFSHWGPYLKNIKEAHQLHIYTDYNFVHPTYPQAMTVLYYIGSFFNEAYSESSVMLVYSIFLHSCVSALVPNIKINADTNGVSKSSRVLFVLFAPMACLLFPYIGYAAPYVSGYLDVILGIFFGTCMLFILETKSQNTVNSLCIAIVMFVLLQIKDIGITFYMISVATYLVEIVVAIYNDRSKKIQYFVQFFMCGITIPLSGKKIWSYLINITGNNIDQFANSNLSNFIGKIRDQLAGTNDYAAQIGEAYLDGILKVDIMWTGVPILIIALVLILVGFVLSYLYSKKGKKYVYIYSIFSIGYFICYLIVLYAIYLCGMSEGEALSNASMDRYIGSFLGGWSFILYGITLKYLYFNSRRTMQFILGLSVAFIYVSLWFCDIPYLRTTKESAGYVWFENHGQNVLNNVEEDSTVWIQSDEDNLQHKYIMTYEIYPVEIDRDLSMNFNEYNIDQMIDIMQERQIEYVYILNGEEEFMEMNESEINRVYDAKEPGALMRLNAESLELVY